MNAWIPTVTREHHQPVSCMHRNGCPCKLAGTYQVSFVPPTERLSVVYEYTTMTLAHLTKTGKVKCSLPLGP